MATKRHPNSNPARSVRRTPNRGRRRRRNRRALGAWIVTGVVILGGALLLLITSTGSDAPAAGATRSIGDDLHSLVALPGGRLYVGGHAAVITSTDGGGTWTAVASLARADAMGWGQRDTTVYASGHPGLNVSDDGGVTFRRSNAGLPSTDLHSFGAGRTTLYSASPAAGLLISKDDGASWQTVTVDAGRAFFGRILVDRTDERHLVASDAQRGPVESRDGGASWRLLDSGSPATWVSSNDPGLRAMIASGPSGAVRTSDGGATWQPVQLPRGAQLVEMAEGSRLFAAGLEGGNVRFWESTNGGASWTER